MAGQWRGDGGVRMMHRCRRCEGSAGWRGSNARAAVVVAAAAQGRRCKGGGGNSVIMGLQQGVAIADMAEAVCERAAVVMAAVVGPLPRPF